MWACAGVKQEAAGEGVSAAAARAGLYADHEVKRELVVGPEVLQPPDAAFPTPASRVELVTVKQECSDADTDASSECLGEYLKEEPVSTESCGERLVLRPCTVLLECLRVDKEYLDVTPHKKCDNKSNLLYELIWDARKNNSTIYKCDKTNNVLTKEKVFTCDTCGTQFTRRSKIIRHLRICSRQIWQGTKTKLKIITKRKKTFSCIYCTKQFIKKTDLTRHERVHTGERPYNCETCDKQFKRSYHLTRHKITHVPQSSKKTYTCHLCKKQFVEKSNLVIHLRYHLGQKPYSCDVCQKQFVASYHLKVHERLHTGDEPYSCEVCQKRFLYKRDATIHKRVHTRETPFSCNVCQKRFSHKSSLNGH